MALERSFREYLAQFSEKAEIRRGMALPLGTYEIDGGINADTIEQAAEAGVDCFVAGSAVYGAQDPAAAVEALRRRARAASPHLRK